MFKIVRFAMLSGALALPGCGAGENPLPNRERAVQLARETLLVDTHVDGPYRMLEHEEDISVRTEAGHFDYPRAREGGLDAPFMSIYVPASYQETGGAKAHAEQLIDMVEGFAHRWPDKFALAYSTDDVRRSFERGLIALPMGMENGAPIEGDLANVEYFHDRGIRYITLTHSENNHICDSSYAKERKWNGLSPFGRQVVAEMNRVGIMIDISHVSDEAFTQVLEISRTPVIASHSSCRRFTPDFERNMSDDMIQALAENGGVIQINFGTAFINEAANKQSLKSWEVVGAFLEEHGLTWSSPEADEKRDEYWTGRTRVPVPMEEVADHIDHVVSLAGIDHVGIGSDYDGVSAVPVGLEDVSRYPRLIEELLGRGYTPDQLRKILSGNILRVWSAVERHAASR